MGEGTEDSGPVGVGSIDHVALAVPDLDTAISFFRDRFAAEVSEAVTLAEQSIRIAFVRLANAEIELMEPLSRDSPIGRFLARNPAGGLHHICLATDDASSAHSASLAQGLRPLNPPRPGYHGRPLFFLHPKATFGMLVEIEEAEREPDDARYQNWRER
ncbi:MAG: methylmalonyl-CoA epimerase [Paracoccaceae bacterium]|nr:methylmalonyl-CoA epimerase [Paracoccaceae bacterium]